ncbi:hypothetical protein HAX54_048389, partial [Datura stramonium]|nr:hypothetical protein [Datura stramonium]
MEENGKRHRACYYLHRKLRKEETREVRGVSGGSGGYCFGRRGKKEGEEERRGGVLFRQMRKKGEEKALQRDEGREVPTFQHEERRDIRPLLCDALRGEPRMSSCQKGNSTSTRK